MQNSKNDAGKISGFSVSSSKGESDAPRMMPNGEAEPSYSEIRMAPVTSAERMLRGGVKFGDAISKTGVSLREIVLDMESRGESVEGIRELVKQKPRQFPAGVQHEL